MTLILILSCTPSSGSVSVDTGSLIEADADTDADTDSDTDVDTPPEPDTSVWIGERDLRYDGCEETLSEEGFELDDSWEYYEYVQDECPKCNHFYEVDVWPEQACGLGISTTVYRGLILDADEGHAEVWGFSNNGTSEYDDNADFDGMNVDYAYDVYDGAVEIVGRINFPELDE